MRIYTITIEDTSVRKPIKRQIGASLDYNKAKTYLDSLREESYEDMLIYIRNQSFVDFFRQQVCLDDEIDSCFRDTLIEEFDKCKAEALRVKDKYLEKYGIEILYTRFDLEEIECIDLE